MALTLRRTLSAPNLFVAPRTEILRDTMSASFNKLLVSPNENDLVAALDAASGRVGEGRRDDWRPALAEVADNAEGRMQIDSVTTGGSTQRYVTAAWWSDHQGRKHVRVVGGTRDYGGKDLHHSLMDRDQRPPLWHVCPQRVFRAKRGDAEPVWLASCACGETGIAQELGWAGDRCGPCHDRREEGVGVEVGVIPWIDAESPIRALVFDWRGERLAVSAGERLSIYDLATGVETIVALGGGEDDGYKPLAFSPDGQWLAGAEPGAGPVILWNMSDVEEQGELRTYAAASVLGLAFSPNGKFLCAVDDDSGIHLWRSDQGNWPRIHAPPGPAYSFDFSPDSRTMAFGMDRDVILLCDVDPLHERERISFGEFSRDAVHYLRFTPGGEDLVILAGNTEYHADDPWYLRRWNLARKEETHHALFRPVSVLDMSPDGRYLAFLQHDQRHSPAAVHFWDLQRWREGGWLEWNPDDDLRCLAFSPDGRWLATGSASGVVKLWPWRSLLEG